MNKALETLEKLMLYQLKSIAFLTSLYEIAHNNNDTRRQLEISMDLIEANIKLETLKNFKELLLHPEK